ncbi:MAG: M23 family metallopeptidase [Opitutales bacterium]|nr:M23 family metallopeptidase [Opitutales bacterium]
MALFKAIPLLLCLTAGTLAARCPTALTIDENYQNWAQATASGRLQSALFGMTRNAGTRFHEGIDIRPTARMHSGEPRDLVYSVLAGTVSHICRENNGSYGRYVVLRHAKNGLEIYTLYAHMAAIAPAIKEGMPVTEGTLLGIMGRSSTVYDIPKRDAHLHFEVGLALGETGFDNYMKRQFGPDSNLHGNDNGFNLVGSDPVVFFKSDDFEKWFKDLKADFCAVVPVKKIPDLKKRCPAIFAGTNDFNAWRIHFTWYGLPLKFEAVRVPASDKIAIENIVPANKNAAVARKILSGNGEAGSTLINYINIIFDTNFKL